MVYYMYVHKPLILVDLVQVCSYVVNNFVTNEHRPTVSSITASYLVIYTCSHFVENIDIAITI